MRHWKIERFDGMYVIAGLGNPGRKYEGTRHNSGFAALDILAERYRIPVASERMKGLCGSGLIDVSDRSGERTDRTV